MVKKRKKQSIDFPLDYDYIHRLSAKEDFDYMKRREKVDKFFKNAKEVKETLEKLEKMGVI